MIMILIIIMIIMVITLMMIMNHSYLKPSRPPHSELIKARDEELRVPRCSRRGNNLDSVLIVMIVMIVLIVMIVMVFMMIV